MHWDFPGSPVVKTLCFHCREHRFKVNQKALYKWTSLPQPEEGCLGASSRLCLTRSAFFGRRMFWHRDRKNKMDSVVGAIVFTGLLWYILFHVEKRCSLTSPNPMIYILFTQTEYTLCRLYFGWWLRKGYGQWLMPNVSFSVAQKALSTTLIHSFLDSFLRVAFFISFEDIKKMNAGVSMIHPRSRP